MSQPTELASSATPAPAHRRYRAALWCVGLGLLANAGIMLWSHLSPRPWPELSLDSKAYAQVANGLPADRMLGAHGLYMMPAQLGPDTWGLYLMDVDAGTISVYRAIPSTSRFRLMAARSFKNDRFLEDFNNESPTPREVQKLVQQQRQREQIEKDTEKKDEPKP